MKLRATLLKFVAATAALALLPAGLGVAQAQSPRCDAWRAEVAQIDRSGGGPGRAAAGAERQLQQVAGQLNRAQSQFAALQCNGAWVFQQPPPECGSLRAQIGGLRQQYAALQQQAGGGGTARRQQLVAAINEHCRAGVIQTQPVAVPVQPQQPRSLFEALFGVQPQQPEIRPGMPEIDGQPPDSAVERAPTFGGGRPVCVRTCDGFFFPLGNSPGGREGQQEMCAALCPAAETEVFYLGRNGDIETAANRRGQPYASLANAGRYTRQFDASCTCRRQGQSWAAALSEAEEMIDRRRGDIIVNERRAAEMSRANQQQVRALEQARQRQEAALRTEAANDAAQQQAVDAQGRAAPTAGTETAGINTGAVGAAVVGANQGERREVTTPAGERRTVRVVAPHLAPSTN